MVQIVQEHRMDAVAFAAYVGPKGHICINADTFKGLAVHDGVTPGGNLVMFGGNNLSELADAAAARTNLELGSASTRKDTFFLQVASNLEDLEDVPTARVNLGLKSAALQDSNFFLHAGNNLNDLDDAASARRNLGIGEFGTYGIGTGLGITGNNVAVSYGTDAGTAAQGNDIRIQRALQTVSNLADVLDKSAGRSNLGVAIGQDVQAHTTALDTLSGGNGGALGNLNASNLSSGTVPHARMPAPAADGLGGVVAAKAPTGAFINEVTSSGGYGADYPTIRLGNTDVSTQQATSTVDSLILTGTTAAGTFDGTHKGTFDGTVPTQSAGDNSGHPATTSFVATATANAVASTIARSDISASTVTATVRLYTSPTYTAVPAGTYAVLFTSSYALRENTATLQLYCNNTAIPGGNGVLTVSSGGSDDGIETQITLLGLLTLTAVTDCIFTVNTPTLVTQALGGGGLLITQVTHAPVAG